MSSVTLKRERRPKRRWRVLIGGVQRGLVYRRAGSRHGWWAELHAPPIEDRPVMHFTRAVALRTSRTDAVNAVVITAILSAVSA